MLIYPSLTPKLEELGRGGPFFKRCKERNHTETVLRATSKRLDKWIHGGSQNCLFSSQK